MSWAFYAHLLENPNFWIGAAAAFITVMATRNRSRRDS